MNFFKRKSSWSNTELGLIKVCVGSMYIIIGTYFHEFFKNYLWIFVLLYIATAIPVFYIWVKQMRTKQNV